METQQKLSAQTVISTLLNDLQERSADVIVSRFGIGKEESETLEAIGKRYGITRERVRQIEADALKQIRSRRDRVSGLLSSLEYFIRGKGGVVDENSLTAEFAKEHFVGSDSHQQYRGLVGLLLTIGDRFERAGATDDFESRWYLDKESLRNQEKIVEGIAVELAKQNNVADESGVIAHAAKIQPNIQKRTVLNFLLSSKNVSQNVFGQWGLRSWGEITPRGVKDKAYLVIKQEGRPLHFREVANLINQHGFSSRSALAQTVHNELIKDNRFVLVGRGLYALREWGYKEGTVKDVIDRILRSKGPLSREDLVQAVLAERFVKPSTIVLNLNSFKKTADGQYTVA